MYICVLRGVEDVHVCNTSQLTCRPVRGSRGDQSFVRSRVQMLQSKSHTVIMSKINKEKSKVKRIDKQSIILCCFS